MSKICNDCHACNNFNQCVDNKLCKKCLDIRSFMDSEESKCQHSTFSKLMEDTKTTFISCDSCSLLSILNKRPTNVSKLRENKGDKICQKKLK